MVDLGVSRRGRIRNRRIDLVHPGNGKRTNRWHESRAIAQRNAAGVTAERAQEWIDRTGRMLPEEDKPHVRDIIQFFT